MSVCGERCPFVVVTLPEKKGALEVIPASWIVKERGKVFCRWPTKSDNVGKLTRLLQDPCFDWDKVRANIVHYSPSYASAMTYKNHVTGGVEPIEREHVPRHQIDFGPIYSYQEACNILLHLEDKIDTINKNMENLIQVATIHTEILKVVGAAKGDLSNESIDKISTFDKLQHLDNRMKDAKQFSILANLLSTLGGKNEYEATRRILSNLISHDLAIKMNWIGSAEKRAITEFPNVVKLVSAAVKLNTKYKDVTEYSVENQIKRWLRYASDRNGGRLKRKRAGTSPSS